MTRDGPAREGGGALEDSSSSSSSPKENGLGVVEVVGFDLDWGAPKGEVEVDAFGPGLPNEKESLTGADIMKKTSCEMSDRFEVISSEIGSRKVSSVQVSYLSTRLNRASCIEGIVSSRFCNLRDFELHGIKTRFQAEVITTRDHRTLISNSRRR